MVELASAPIGVFDSGLGGLSVLTHLQRRLPFERYIYLADTLHVPYGSRSEAEIRELTLQAVAWLHSQGCKLIVIACNSASAHGLQAARRQYPQVPIVGLVPALKPAVMQSTTKQVAVLATPATLHGYLLNEVIEQVAKPQQVTVHKYSFNSLVPWVELGMPSNHLAVTDLDHLLSELQAKKVDQLVLGCTHFPFFKAYLAQRIDELMTHQAMGQVALIDSGDAIAKRVYDLLEKANQLASHKEQPRLQFYATANLPTTEQAATRLLQRFLPELGIDFFTLCVTQHRAVN